MNNPLLEKSVYYDDAVAFEKIQAAHFVPALDEAIVQAKQRHALIKNNNARPTFDNTVLALETSGEHVELIGNIFSALFNAHGDQTLRSLAKEIMPKLASFSNDIVLDTALFARLRQVYDEREHLNLPHEHLELLKKYYRDFVRNGALLSETQKERIREIDQKLAQLSPQFADNVLHATNAYEMILDSEDLLAGLPDFVKEGAAQTAQEKGHAGKWVITLQAPSFIPFLKYAERRDLRQQLWQAYYSRCFNDQHDNQNNIKEIISLRRERANLLGYPTHADFVLEERMALSPDNVNQFLKRILTAAKPSSVRELDELTELMRSLGQGSELMPWDFAFYSEKLKQKKFSFSDEDLMPYFQLEKVMTGLFAHARRLYDLDLTLDSTIPTYHPDVKVYRVTDTQKNKYLGLFYVDLFPRETKNSGAWMTTLRNQGLLAGQIKRPHTAIVCNFSPSTPNKPALLRMDEVETLFHEFGHALHSLLSECTFVSLSGTNVFWDFVELPSQIMENWVREKDGLNLFAYHYATKQPMPEDLIKKLKESARFMAGYNCVRQLSFGLLDMAWHSHTHPEQIKDVDTFEVQAQEPAKMLPKIAGTNMSCCFSHIFGGGYSAGYYSYKWAEVLEADAFELFKEQGIFNRQVADRFRQEILSKGASSHPMELYKKFRGREPDPNALLRRDGLI